MSSLINFASSIPFISLQDRAKELGLRVELKGDEEGHYFHIYRVVDNELLSSINGDLSVVSCFLAGWYHCKTYYEKEPPSEWFLRVALEARDKEWWLHTCQDVRVEPNPKAVNKWLDGKLKELKEVIKINE